jgi:hypothetical protein
LDLPMPGHDVTSQLPGSISLPSTLTTAMLRRRRNRTDEVTLRAISSIAHNASVSLHPKKCIDRVSKVENWLRTYPHFVVARLAVCMQFSQRE